MAAEQYPTPMFHPCTVYSKAGKGDHMAILGIRGLRAFPGSTLGGKVQDSGQVNFLPRWGNSMAKRVPSPGRENT